MGDYVNVINTSKLSKHQRELLLQSLYANDSYETKYKLELTLNYNGVISNPDVILMSRHIHKLMPDCKISNFYYNYYFRTLKGQKFLKYNTMGTLLKNIRGVCIRNGYELRSNLRVYYKRKHIFNIEI